MIHIVLVDDHTVLRAGLRALLETQADFRVVAEASGGSEAVAAVRACSPDVVLLDLDLGAPPDGIAVTSLLRALPEPPQVLIFTTYDADADIVRGIEAGAVGYLLKSALPAEIFQAVRQAAQGQSALSPPAASVLLQQVQNPQATLTPREAEILTLLTQGLSNRELSTHLSISETTVKTHLAHIYDKLGADSRGSAVAIALQRGLTRPRPGRPSSAEGPGTL